MNKKIPMISSEQLLHFVRRQTYLVDILNHNFYPRFCCEDTIHSFYKNSDVYVPMKCFCDIPLEYVKNHMTVYGKYGIGFKKAWGIKAGITPVIYYNEKSPYIEYMKKIYNENIGHLNAIHIDEQAMDIITTLKSSFTMYKPVYGKYARIKKENYCFYNEREWRYIIPHDSDISSYLQVGKHQSDILADIIKKYNVKYELNNQIAFSYDDIEFVIIPNENTRDAILQKLHVPQSDIEKLRLKMKTIDTLINEN